MGYRKRLLAAGNVQLVSKILLFNNFFHTNLNFLISFFNARGLKFGQFDNFDMLFQFLAFLSYSYFMKKGPHDWVVSKGHLNKLIMHALQSRYILIS